MANLRCRSRQGDSSAVEQALTQRLNSLALRREAHIVENCGDKASADLKRLLESLIEKAN